MKGNVCSGCGGRLEFSPTDKMLKCINCGATYPIEYKQTYLKHNVGDVNSQAGIQKWMETNKAYQCSNCGAQIVLNKFDISTTCQYCKASAFVPQKDLPGLKPELIIPFKFSKEEAKSIFTKNVVKRHFLSGHFKKNLPNTEIGSTYISSFIFDCNLFVSYSGTRKEYETIKDKDGTTRTITHYRHFSGTKNKSFNNLVVEVSDKLDQSDIDNIFPFNFDEGYDYNDDFIRGYNVGYYNRSVEDAERIAKNNALSVVRNEIEWEYDDIVSLDVHPTFSNMKYNYALLPIYFINFKYKDKPYINLMNGQTGKFSGSLPRSAGKISALIIFIVLIVLGVLGLILFYLN